MNRSMLLIFLLISLIAFSKNRELKVHKKYARGNESGKNWQELNYYKEGNLVKLTYNDQKQKIEAPLLVIAFWKDTEEDAVKMKVRCNALAKDVFLVKIYENTDKSYATMDKIDGNFHYSYFRKFDKVK